MTNNILFGGGCSERQSWHCKNLPQGYADKHRAAFSGTDTLIMSTKLGKDMLTNMSTCADKKRRQNRSIPQRVGAGALRLYISVCTLP